MASAEVKIVFRIDVELVSDFVPRMQEYAEQLADGYRCPSVGPEDMRCEGRREHGGDRHSAGNFSWPVVDESPKMPEATGHFGCPSPGPFGNCEKSPHHHWRSPIGRGWILPGLQSDCTADHLAEWNAGTL